MKYTKKCPICGGTEIYRVEAVVGNNYGFGNVIPTGLLGTIKVNRYICGRCGYAEEYVEGKDLDTLKRKFPRIYNRVYLRLHIGGFLISKLDKSHH